MHSKTTKVFKELCIRLYWNTEILQNGVIWALGLLQEEAVRENDSIGLAANIRILLFWSRFSHIPGCSGTCCVTEDSSSFWSFCLYALTARITSVPRWWRNGNWMQGLTSFRLALHQGQVDSAIECWVHGTKIFSFMVSCQEGLKELNSKNQNWGSSSHLDST